MPTGRWVGHKYDTMVDSGGNTERPALQRLLEDIRAGKIEIIVVYKVDRLTRSLADFAKLVELFDQHSVSLVSVTQQFNTTTRNGPAASLNMVLSFAAFFERRGSLGAHPRQDCRFKTQGPLGRGHGSPRV